MLKWCQSYRWRNCHILYIYSVELNICRLKISPRIGFDETVSFCKQKSSLIYSIYAPNLQFEYWRELHLAHGNRVTFLRIYGVINRSNWDLNKTDKSHGCGHVLLIWTWTNIVHNVFTKWKLYPWLFQIAVLQCVLNSSWLDTPWYVHPA